MKLIKRSHRAATYLVEMGEDRLVFHGMDALQPWDQVSVVHGNIGLILQRVDGVASSDEIPLGVPMVWWTERGDFRFGLALTIRLRPAPSEPLEIELRRRTGYADFEWRTTNQGAEKSPPSEEFRVYNTNTEGSRPAAGAASEAPVDIERLTRFLEQTAAGRSWTTIDQAEAEILLEGLRARAQRDALPDYVGRPLDDAIRALRGHGIECGVQVLMADGDKRPRVIAWIGDISWSPNSLEAAFHPPPMPILFHQAEGDTAIVRTAKWLRHQIPDAKRGG